MGLSDHEAGELGPDAAARIRGFRLLVVLAQRIRVALDRRLEPEGFTSQQAVVYTAVDAIGTPRLTELAGSIGMTHQNLRQIVNALERKGMLAVTPDPRDARARRVEVTDSGREHWRERPHTGHDLVLDWFADVTPQEVEIFLQVLTKVGARVR